MWRYSVNIILNDYCCQVTVLSHFAIPSGPFGLGKTPDERHRVSLHMQRISESFNDFNKVDLNAPLQTYFNAS